jgi:hypothetical protein
MKSDRKSVMGSSGTLCPSKSKCLKCLNIHRILYRDGLTDTGKCVCLIGDGMLEGVPLSVDGWPMVVECNYWEEERDYNSSLPPVSEWHL